MKPRTRIASLIATATVLAGSLVAVVAANAATAEDFAQLRQKWEVSLTGGSDYDVDDPDIAARITGITADAQALWDAMDTSPDRIYLWPDAANVTRSAQKTTSYTRVASLALAYRTHGSALAGDQALRDDIVNALEWLYANAYNETMTQSGNWWDWFIGVPAQLVDAVDLMRSDLSAEQIQRFMRPVVKFPNFSGMTGANLVWVANVWARSGALLDNDARIARARDELHEVFLYVTSSDGFYEDGSFVQHKVVAYNGGYGSSLLEDLTEIIDWLEGSPWEITDPGRANVTRWVYDAFEPLMYRGLMMDMTRGREVSRSYLTDHSRGHSIIGTVMRVVGFAPAADAAHFRGLVKGWILDDTYRDYFQYASLPDIVKAKAIVGDASVAPLRAADQYHQYASMDRAVQWRPDYTFALSMSSDRIATHESINDENVRGWYQGEGMTYLYNPDISQYTDFWPTVDPYHLPGTTIDTHARTDADGNRYRNAEREAGGAEILGLYGTSSMKLLAQSSTLRAKKSWFAFDNEIVALGTGITSTDNRAIQTTVDNRKLAGAGDQQLTVDGTVEPSNLGWSAQLDDVGTIHLAGNVPGADLGYYFPKSATVDALRQSRTGAWSDIDQRPTALTDPITAQYLTLWLDHGSNPTNGTYQYALLPGQSAAEVDAYGDHPDFTVLANTPDVQAVQENTLGVTGIQFWNPATAAGVTSNARAAVMTAETADGLQISVADPSQRNTGTIALEIDRAATSVLSLDPGVTVTQLSPTIKLQVEPGGSLGTTFHAGFSFAPVTSAPAAPVLRDTISAGGQLQLSWDPASQAQGYVVKYGTTPGNYTTTVDVGLATKHVVSGLTGGQTYYYTVSAYNTLGAGPDSTEGSATPLYSGVVDNSDPTEVTIVGDWALGTSGGYYGPNYLHDWAANRGTKSVTYTPDLPPGLYQISVWYPSHSNRSTVVPITIQGKDSVSTVTVNQRQSGSRWRPIGTYLLAGDGTDYVRISNTGTSDGYVVADAVRFDQVSDTTPPITVAGTGSTAGEDEWYTSAVTVTLTATDDMAGVAGTSYIVDGGTEQQGTSVHLTTDGEHTIAFRSTDRLGNVEPWRELTVQVDTTPPDFTYDVAGGAGTVPPTITGLAWTDVGLDSPSGDLTRTGYAFAGWNTARDGSGTTVTATTTAYDASTRGTDVATLYAQWTVTAPTWDSTQTYEAGDLVYNDGRVYQAQWWTSNQVPGASPWGPWAELGDNVACPHGAVREWTPSSIYLGGETAVHNGQQWTATWWTRNQEPGATASGPWTPIGAC
ncbi:polysaccharide lyase family 8 super-sandwich domain-containing protein [Phytohabitans kaempferiae]|uniref:Polysaccharide lyase family 8 super-sandwich domain-containing protein n=1 Tax=Phytohabitans kaempferiae TaxID=1620943 RepID=A0ABV6MBE6_9ACTN